MKRFATAALWRAELDTRSVSSFAAHYWMAPGTGWPVARK